MLLKAPFRLPPGFLAAFGYPGGRRFVALYWEPCGDEACYDDGVSSACGMSNNWLYLDFIHRPQVQAWLDANGINLASAAPAEAPQPGVAVPLPRGQRPGDLTGDAAGPPSTRATVKTLSGSLFRPRNLVPPWGVPR
jgi:hypothetical protein